jgi:hypothetical protein
MSRDYFAPGDWNAVCDQCGSTYKASELRLQWDNARVCRTCWDPRHPQELQGPQPVPSNPGWMRPNFIPVMNFTTDRVMDAGGPMDFSSMG